MDLQPVDFLQGLGGIQALPHPYDDQQQVIADQQRTQGNAQALQLGAEKLSAIQQQQQAEQQYATDVQSYLAKPSAQGAIALTLKHPEQAASIKQAHDLQDTATKTQNLTQLGNVFAYLSNNKPDLATKSLQDRIDAEKAAGLPTDDDEQVLSLISSGNPDDLAKAKGIAGYQLAAVLGPDKWGETLKTLGLNGDKGETGKVVGKSIGHYEGNKFVVDYRDPDEGTLERIEGVDGDGNKTVSFVRVGGSGGGGPASSGGGGLPVGTPAIVDRIATIEGTGQNPDSSAVGVGQFLKKTWLGTYKKAHPDSGMTDEQILAQRSDPTVARQMLTNLVQDNAQALQDAGIPPTADNLYIAHFLGTGGAVRALTASPDTPIPQVVSPREIAANPTTLGKFQNVGQLRQWAAGKMAAGVPGSGASGASGGGQAQAPASGVPGAIASFVTQPVGAEAANIVPGDISTVPANMRASVQAIAEGRRAPPRTGSPTGEALMNIVTAYDPTFDAANATSRVKTRVDFTSGQSARAVNALNTAAGHLIHLDEQIDDLHNNSFLPGILNPIKRADDTKIRGSSAYNTFEQTKQAAASELRKVFSGAAGGNLAELESWESTIDSTKSPKQLHDAIRNGVILMGARLDALKDQYATGMGRSDQIPQFIKPSLARTVNLRFGFDLNAGNDPAPPAAPPQTAPTHTATNPKTGQKIALVNGQWVPVK